MRTALMDRLNGDADPMPGDIASASEELERLTEQNAELREALEWYAEQTRLCRLIHSEGDAGRNALAADGGTKARTAIAKARGEPPARTQGES